jgi:Transposase DDE domain group 1
MRAGAFRDKDNTGLVDPDRSCRKGTRSVMRIRGLAGRVEVGTPDASLTPASGVVAVAELVGRLGVIDAFDDAVGVIKQRDRGLTAGQFLVALAQTQMLGAEFLTGLDRRRDDAAGEALSAVPTPASTTAATLAERFGPVQLAGIEEGIGEITCRVVGLLPAKRRAALRAGTATIDLDGTDVEVYGSRKDGIAYSYKGARAGRPHVATWAEAGLVTAADLLAGDEDPRPGAGSLIERSVATLTAAGVTTRPRVRGDVGYFAKEIAWAAVDTGCDFSLGVTRNKAAWRAAAAIPADAWRRAKRMKGAQVAVMDYAPAGWPPDTGCVVRRVKVKAATISTDPRARRRRTIPKDQLALALDGLVNEVYAYSFIATNLDVSTPAKAVAVEAWHRMRTDIEDRIRDAKHGAALRHLPSGTRAVNTVWMWGALLAINMSAWLQELAGIDDGAGRGRAHLGTLRHRLLNVPARLIRHAGQAILRLPPGHQLLATVLARLRHLPIWT